MTKESRKKSKKGGLFQGYLTEFYSIFLILLLLMPFQSLAILKSYLSSSLLSTKFRSSSIISPLVLSSSLFHSPSYGSRLRSYTSSLSLRLNRYHTVHTAFLQQKLLGYSKNRSRKISKEILNLSRQVQPKFKWKESRKFGTESSKREENIFTDEGVKEGKATYVKENLNNKYVKNVTAEVDESSCHFSKSGFFSKSKVNLNHLFQNITSSPKKTKKYYGKEIHPYWYHRLQELQRPVTRNLVQFLTNTNALGYDAATSLISRKGTLFDFILQEKKRHKDKVILTRVGEFYETYGIDSLMLIEYCGLNPMGNKAKAGCPIRNIQQTLDGLTEAGLTVAVYEEVNDIDLTSKSTSRSRIKNRILTQIVSPGCSTYLYDCCLRQDDIDYKENRPYISICQSSSGAISMAKMFLDSKIMKITERMTEEALRVALSSTAICEPIYIQGVDSKLTTQNGLLTQYERKELRGHPVESFHRAVLHRIENELELPALTKDIRILQEYSASTNKDQVLAHNRPRPLYMSTATQIGILANPNVPDLIPFLLPMDNSYSYSQQFLRNWLLTPPPYYIADHMQSLCRSLSVLSTSLPMIESRPIPVGKLVSMLSSLQANAPLFREIVANVKFMSSILDQSKSKFHEDSSFTSSQLLNMNISSDADASTYESFLPHLLEISKYESGIEMSRDLLKESATRVIKSIVKVVQMDFTKVIDKFDENEYISSYQDEDERNTKTIKKRLYYNNIDNSNRDPFYLIPQSFFDRNEQNFRGCVAKGASDDVFAAYVKVDDSATALSKAVFDDFPQENEISYDIINNLIYMKKKPTLKSTEVELIDDRIITKETSGNIMTVDDFTNPIDRHGKPILKRYTTKKVENALSNYLTACEEASSVMKKALQTLSAALIKDLPVIIYTMHLVIILGATTSHVRSAIARGWTLPKLEDLNSPTDNMENSEVSQSSQMSLNRPMREEEQTDLASSSSPVPQALVILDLIPFWLDRFTATSNDISLEGIQFLTAPNMSGKSTLMRSLAVAVLLANCGLFIPALKNAKSLPSHTDAKVKEANENQNQQMTKNATSLPSSASTSEIVTYVPRFDNIFVRTASYDVPSEGKSAFALEMDDIRVMFRDCTARSLVMLDEIGKGTSARDGSALSGAIIEELDQVNMKGIFATHLHEVLDLPIHTETVVCKRMGEDYQAFQGEINHLMWSYKLHDGVCRDSMAIYTAKNYKLPGSVIERAEELMENFDRHCRNAGETEDSSAAKINANLKFLITDEPLPPWNARSKKDQSGSKQKGKREEMIEILKEDERKEKRKNYNQVEFDSKNSISIFQASKVLLQVFKDYLKKIDFHGIPDSISESEFEGMETIRSVKSLKSGSQIFHIKDNHSPPPILEGQPCLYVLSLHKSQRTPRSNLNSIRQEKNESSLFYIGETEGVRQRLKQHRRTFKSKGFDCLQAIVIPVEDKSLAKILESLAIQKFKDQAIPLIADKDGRRRVATPLGN